MNHFLKNRSRANPYEVLLCYLAIFSLSHAEFSHTKKKSYKEQKQQRYCSFLNDTVINLLHNANQEVTFSLK